MRALLCKAGDTAIVITFQSIRTGVFKKRICRLAGFRNGTKVESYQFQRVPDPLVRIAARTINEVQPDVVNLTM
jgi:hypothetical protein